MHLNGRVGEGDPAASSPGLSDMALCMLCKPSPVTTESKPAAAGALAVLSGQFSWAFPAVARAYGYKGILG